MEDEGRQRTTKYISKLFVEQSKLSLQFTKERQRSQHLRVTHLTEPEPEPELEPEPEPDPPAGVSEEDEGAKDTKLKQAKLSFSKKATPLKSEWPITTRVRLLEVCTGFTLKPNPQLTRPLRLYFKPEPEARFSQ